MTEAIIRPHGGKWYTGQGKKTKTYTYDQLRAWQAENLDFKIAWAKERIERALGQLKIPAVAFSAGKDSTVLLHLLKQYAPDIITIYGNTTIEFPECIRFARRLRDEWKLNFYEVKPEVTFWWVVQEYGWPLMGKTFGVGGVAHKTSREQFFDDLAARGELTGQYKIQSEVPISSACCTFLKERPSRKMQKQLGVDGIFLGILAHESRQRLFNFLQYGEWYYPKNQKIWKCHPLAIWTDADIWDYIRRFDVPYASLYDMGFRHEMTGEWISHKRNGCMFCGMDLQFPNNHLAIMRRTHPKAWSTLMLHHGLGKVLMDLRFALDGHQYDMFEEQWPINEYLDRFPCAFDRICPGWG
jgi:3'-phosphoadenosine 5'-phosphosulfate sulfotransferase (PAPS reductase)/FAD synthetase